MHTRATLENLNSNQYSISIQIDINPTKENRLEAGEGMQDVGLSDVFGTPCMDVCHYYSPLNYLAHAARATPPTATPPSPRCARMHSRLPAGPRTRMCALLRYLSPYIPLWLDSPPPLLLSERQHVNNPLPPWPRQSAYVCITYVSREDDTTRRGGHGLEGRDVPI